MKKTKIVLLMALVSATLFSAVIFTACTKKTTCSNIICRNDGVCNNGNCVCPTGYYGTFCELGVNSFISYKNNTFTPITLVITNGATHVIPVGQSFAVEGTYGTAVVGTATTSGTASSLGVDNAGGVIGLSINWAINNNFPSGTGDTLKQSLDVGATYFFLRMANKSAQNILDYYVNVNFSYGSTYQDVTVPNNGVTYDMGYYLAYSSSNVQTQSSNSRIVWMPVTLPFTNNQSFTVTIN